MTSAMLIAGVVTLLALVLFALGEDTQVSIKLDHDRLRRFTR